MSTIAPPSKPLSPALVDSEHYIDDQIRRTRRALKLVDLAAGLITLAIGALGFVLLAAVLDHWVVPGGLSVAGRVGVFGVMLLALGWYAWRTFVPLLRPINPVYAAQTIERGAPSLKNSLLNLLLFRTHRQQMSARVYHALEQQAALRLSSAPIDTSIDRTALLRLGYALLLIVAACAAYAVLSPKNMAVSAARVLAPWTDIAPPSRVQILDVKPGDTAVALGEQIEISAELAGLRDGERVQIRYSTLDEQIVEQSAPMKLPAANARRYAGLLPPDGYNLGHGNGRETLGVQQDLIYWIEAGDARSKRYKASVFTRPTITVQKVRYDYPAYTGYPSEETTNTGDVSGIEGTQITISALANKPIKSAYIDFDADGRNDLKMNIDGDRATASFVLGLRENRRTPKHGSYVLRFTSAENRANDDPPKYKIEVKPDYAPEVRITEPGEPELTIRLDETVPIGVEARDPDFALAGVRLVGKVGDREIALMELLEKRHEGRFGAIRPFTPAEAQLKPGDVLEYWAEARDNRRPDANVAMSEHRRLRIAAPDQQNKEQQQQQGGGQGQPQQGGGQEGDQQQNGQQGAGGQGQQQNSGQDGDQQNGENQGQQGPGGTSAQGQQNDKAQSEQGAGGQGNAGESQNSQQQQESGQGGGQSANSESASADGQQQNDQQQPNGASNSATQGGQPQGGAQQQQQAGESTSAGESASGEGQQQNAGAQSGSPQDAQPGEQQAAASEKVSSQGDDDSTAMQRIAEHLNEQNGEPQQPQNQKADGESASAGGQSTQQQEGQPGSQQAQGQTEGQQQNSAQQQQQDAQPPQGQNANRTQGQQNGANQAQQQGQRSGRQQAADGESASAGGEQQDAANSPQNSAAGAKGASKNNPQQKPSANGAESNEPRQQPGDAQQQGAGQQDGQRQGDETPRESKPGDGANQQPGAQQPSAESNANNNQSDAGAGHNSDEQQGSTSQNNMQGAEKRDGDRNQKLEGDKEPPGGANSKRESDSQGGQSGDQAGGGQEGAGQRSDAAGKGAEGQNEAADSGAGRADEQGQGATGSQAGREQLADGETGQTSGDQKGAGSQQREAGEPAASEPGEQQGLDKPGGEQASQPQGGDQKQAGGEPASAGEQSDRKPSQDAKQRQQQQAKPSQHSQQRQPGDQQPSSQSQGGPSGSAQPQSGGHGGVATSSNQPMSEEAREDEANLQYAREQTNLVLQRLEDQLAKQQVDQNMLKNLGWTEEELRQFVDRWKGLKERAQREGDDGADAREELDDALRSLGLRKQGPTRTRAASKDDKLQMNDSYRTRPPVEYADRVRAYSKSVSSE